MQGFASQFPTQLLVISTLVVVTSCVGAGRIREEVSALRAQIDTAKTKAADTCAPDQYARAQSQLSFAEQELKSGEPHIARRHVEAGLAHVSQAIAATTECSRMKVVVEKAPTVVVLPESNDDTDHDSISDDLDKCPNDAEDIDQSEDDDGCPDVDYDTDGDGIVDRIDKCADKPETMNGVDDQDGCPDVGRVVIQEKAIELKEKIFFQSGKAVIGKSSFSLLDEVAAVLRANPKISVSIDGHTDGIGAAVMNLKLSRARANAVREFLIGRGIDPERLQARGFGETLPLATNQTAVGREKNRRVEINITKKE